MGSNEHGVSGSGGFTKGMVHASLTGVTGMHHAFSGVIQPRHAVSRLFYAFENKMAYLDLVSSLKAWLMPV